MPFSRATAAETNGSLPTISRPKAAGAFGHFETDASETQNAQGLAAQLGALQALLLPLAGVHGAVGGRQLARERKHEADGELGDGDRVGTRGVHDHDAAARGGFSIDVVDTDAGSADDTQPGSLFHQSVVGLNRGANDERIRIGEGSRQAVRQFVVGQHFPAGFSCEHCDRGGRHFFGQNNLHCVAPLMLCGLVFVEADSVLFAEEIEHAHDGCMRLAFSALVLGEGVGMDAQLFRHLILEEIELPAGDEQLFSRNLDQA